MLFLKKFILSFLRLYFVYRIGFLGSSIFHSFQMQLSLSYGRHPDGGNKHIFACSDYILIWYWRTVGMGKSLSEQQQQQQQQRESVSIDRSKNMNCESSPKNISQFYRSCIIIVAKQLSFLKTESFLSTSALKHDLI